MPPDVIQIGLTNGRGTPRPFGVRLEDRRHHLYVIGQTGTGKTTLIESLVRQDLASRDGMILLDPHGDLAERLCRSASPRVGSRIIVFDPADPSSQLRFNPLAGVRPESRSRMVGSLLEAFERLWPSAWGVRLEHLLRNTLLTLLEQPTATLIDIPRLYGQPQYRRTVVASLSNPEVRRFWVEEFDILTDRQRAEMAAPILNKLGAFIADPMMRRVVSEPGTNLDIRAMMDGGQALIANLAKGRLGGPNAALLGSLILSRVELAAFERIEIPESDRPNVWVYVDEMQHFVSLTLASMLSELRKYRVGFILAHQYLGQLTDEVRRAILGNVGTLISFRVGLEDARQLEPLFSPIFDREDLAMLPNYSLYLRLMIDGHVSKAFSAATLLNSPVPPSKTSFD